MAVAWLSGFSRRYKVTVTENSGGALSDHQVGLFSFTLSAMPVSPVFENMRVTNSDGTTLIDFWRVSYNNVAKTVTFYAEIPVLSASSNRDIYLYVGKSSGSDASSYSNTMTKIPNNLSGLQQLYHFDTGSGLTAFDSVAGGTYPLTLGGTVTPVWQGTDGGNFEDSNPVVSFNSGSHLYFTNGEAAGLTPYSNEFTTLIWYRGTSSSGHQRLLSRGADVGDKVSWYVSNLNGKAFAVLFYGAGVANVNITSTVNIDDDKWHLISLRNDPSNNLAYLKVDNNAKKSVALSQSVKNVDASFAVGNSEFGHLPVTGYLDEAAVFTRAVSDDELDDMWSRRKFASTQPTWVLGALEELEGLRLINGGLLSNPLMGRLAA